MKKVMLVFGTRPEAIKMAPLVKEYQKHRDEYQCLVCVTAQHREMLDQVLDIFQIVPDYDLNIMKAGQDLYDVTSRVLLGMRDVLKESKPDLVLVHGDTSTSTTAALAAFYQQIPVGHVEAGLRTHNLYSPWPEEANRQITSRLATYHFAPTELAKQNLLDEGISEMHIKVTGNTVIDALHMALDKIESDKELEGDLIRQIRDKGYPMHESADILLVTGHRRENHGQGLINICNALRHLSEKYPHIDIVYPVHLNPKVQETVYSLLDDKANIYLIEPLEYLTFIMLMNASKIILTDSGGIQEEAPSLGKPVIVMRDSSERPEGLSAGTVKLVGANTELIIQEVSRLIDDTTYYKKMSRLNNPYGDGFACGRILKIN